MDDVVFKTKDQLILLVRPSTLIRSVNQVGRQKHKKTLPGSMCEQNSHSHCPPLNVRTVLAESAVLTQFLQ